MQTYYNCWHQGNAIPYKVRSVNVRMRGGEVKAATRDEWMHQLWRFNDGSGFVPLSEVYGWSISSPHTAATPTDTGPA